MVEDGTRASVAARYVHRSCIEKGTHRFVLPCFLPFTSIEAGATSRVVVASSPSWRPSPRVRPPPLLISCPWVLGKRGGTGEGQRAGEIVWEGLRGRGVRTNVRDEKTSSTVVGASATKRLERERRASASTAPEETARDRRRKVGASASAKEDGGNPTDVQGAFPNVTRDSTERNGTSQVISKAKTPHHAR